MDEHDALKSHKKLSMKCGIQENDKIEKISLIQRHVKTWLLHR